LGYILSPGGDAVLMIHRNTRPDDLHYGKYNGLGGKLDSDEDVVSGMRREIREEAGIEAEELVLRGTISWPGFGKNGEDWFGFIFLITGWTGEVYDKNVEGTLSWEPVERLLSGELPVWEGDKFFMPLVFDQDPRAFHGVMPYAEGRPVDWRYDRL
jgi:8-oxo-dGTP diphosphatase